MEIIKQLKHILNRTGVALLMVLSSISLMAFLLADLTFETQLNQIRVYNLQDKLQARLNAEAGINFAMAKLKLYQQAFNLLEKNENLQQVLKPSTLQGLITQPFIYPIPQLKGASANQKSILDEFAQSVSLRGKLSVNMSAVSGFLNPNNMRIERKVDQNQNGQNPDNDGFGNNNNLNNGNGQGDGKQKSPQQLIEEELVEIINQSMEKKRETDIDFDNLYGNLDPNLLVKEIKFFVNRPEDFQDVERAEIEAQYLAKGIKPKHAPMTSIDEMYSLVGWPDAMVDLIKDRLTVHEVAIIPANEMTEDQLKVVFPLITEKQMEDFFTLRDGDPVKEIEPQEFANLDDFKNAIVNTLALVSSNEFDQRMKELEVAGLRIGTAGKLFKVEAIGEYERAVYRIVAYVDLPIKPEPPEKKKKTDNQNEGRRNTGITDGNNPEDEDNPQDEPEDNKEDDKKKKKKPTELLEPRVIETRLN